MSRLRIIEWRCPDLCFGGRAHTDMFWHWRERTVMNGARLVLLVFFETENKRDTHIQYVCVGRIVRCKAFT